MRAAIASLLIVVIAYCVGQAISSLCRAFTGERQRGGVNTKGQHAGGPEHPRD